VARLFGGALVNLWLKPPHATPVEPPLKQTQLNLIYIGIFAQNIVWFGVRGFTGASLGDFSRLFGIYTDPSDSE